MEFEEFYFDGVLVDSPEAWTDIKASHSGQDVLEARQHVSGKTDFGFGADYSGKTLYSWFKDNNMEL